MKKEKTVVAGGEALETDFWSRRGVQTASCELCVARHPK